MIISFTVTLAVTSTIMHKEMLIQHLDGTFVGVSFNVNRIIKQNI